MKKYIQVFVNLLFDRIKAAAVDIRRWEPLSSTLCLLKIQLTSYWPDLIRCIMTT